MRPVARALLVATAAALAAGPSAAAPPRKPAVSAPAATPAQEAKQHFDAGLKAFRAKRYDRAIAELEIAMAFDPQAATLRMLAFAYKETKRFVEAHAAYEKLRASYWSRLAPADQGDVMLMLSMLEHLTAQIEVHCDERGADVFVDGERVAATPLKEPVRVLPGAHRVRATLAGSLPLEHDVRLEPKQRLALTLKFVPESGDKQIEVKPFPTGKLFLDADPPDALVFVDGAQVGKGQVELTLRTGRHRVEVAAASHRSFLEDVSVEEDKTASRTVRLVRVGPTPEEAAAAAAPKEEPFDGFYGMATLGASFGLLGGKVIPCPEGGTCVGQFPIGGSVLLRLGYSFGVFGLEGAVGFLGDTHPERQSVLGAEAPGEDGFDDGLISREQAFVVYGVGGFAGAGMRVTTQDRLVRLTFGLTPGAALSRMALRREVTGLLRDTYVATATSTSFGLLGDAGILVGSSPGGARFSAGVVVGLVLGPVPRTPSGDPRLVPFETGQGPVDATIPTPAYPLSAGAQLFVGPTLGLHWGR